MLCCGEMFIFFRQNSASEIGKLCVLVAKELNLREEMLVNGSLDGGGARHYAGFAKQRRE